MPFETYATLLNLKKVLPSTKSNFIAIDKDYWVSIFSTTVGEVDLDERWYLQKYQDVLNAVSAGTVKSAADHYCNFGYFEHRMPYFIEVESRWYLSEYADIQEALNQRIFVSAQDHFEQIGYQEGRHPYAGFALRKKTEPASRAKNY